MAFSWKTALWGLIPSRLLIRRLHSRDRVYLTFDDGPHPENTPVILDILKQHAARASFFVVGREAVKYPDLVRKMSSEGHTVAGHSWSHRRLRQFAFRDCWKELHRTGSAVAAATGSEAKLFRPPYGHVTLPMLAYAIARRMRIVLWSVDSDDDRTRSAEAVLDRGRQVRAGDILLCHDDNERHPGGSSGDAARMAGTGAQAVSPGGRWRHIRGQEIRILHVIETLEVGGAETVVANLVNNASPGFRPGVCCLMRTGPVAARIRPGVEIIELGKTGEGNDYRIPFRLAQILQSRRIDIVQSHDWGTLLETAAAAALARTAAVHMAHGPTIHYPAGDGWAPIKRRMRRGAERLASLKLKRAIAVSEVVRRELLEDIGIPAGKVALVRNGIDLALKPPGDLGIKRQQLGLTAGDVLLVTVGRMAPIKNYSVLLQALAISAAEAPGLKLAMVGDGPERAKLEADAERLGLAGRVSFLGERNDVSDWLAIAHIFVLPSLYEGISIALLEAMAAGLPAVVSRVGGNPEVVVDGQTGLIVESGDAAGLARALVELAGDETRRRRMGLAARARVEAEFDLAKAVRRHEEIYLEALGGAEGLTHVRHRRHSGSERIRGR